MNKPADVSVARFGETLRQRLNAREENLLSLLAVNGRRTL